MLKDNPYAITFGEEPREMIRRTVQEQEILDTFLAETPSNRMYMISGVRGVGKTVFMTSIANSLQSRGWIVVELNPERDLLQSLAAKLSSDHQLALDFQMAGINLSFWGLGLEVKNIAPITDIETALIRMLEKLDKKGKRVLISIDEVSNTSNMKVFAGSFQIFARKKLPVFLIMTGLYENISELQNEKNLTFLYRAPKMILNPLNIGTIASNYQKNFHKPHAEAVSMAKLTNGYSFAFQVLGYLTWQNNGDYTGIMDQYRQYLEDYVYEKIWSTLSRTDKKVMCAIASSESGKILEIREAAHMTTNQFNPYRKRLIQKGIVNGQTYGYLTFTLPMFRDFVMEK